MINPMGCPSLHKIRTARAPSDLLVIQVSFSLSFDMEIYEASRYDLKVNLKTKKFFHLGRPETPIEIFFEE